MQLIVTRPAAQAAAWVRELQVLGQPAHALPLIDIGPAADLAPVRAAWQGLPRFALVMFVSANAVAHFFARAPVGAGWPGAVRAASTGPGTSAALRAAGVPDACLVEPAPEGDRFDSEALWTRLAGEDWAGRAVLVVRGEEGRDWFADTLRGHGAGVEFVAAYARRPPRIGPAGRALLDQALANPAAYLWHFSSSQAVGHLRALAPTADWSGSSALASHPRIVQAACDAGFGRVEVVGVSPEAVALRAAQWPPIQSASQ